MGILGLEKSLVKIPHFRVHKPKIALVGSMVVKTAQVGDLMYEKI